MQWQTAWQLIKDVALTGTGLVIIIVQIWSPKPSDVLLVVGLALTVPAAASHAASILSGPGASPSPPSGTHEAPPSLPSSEPAGGQPSPPSPSSSPE